MKGFFIQLVLSFKVHIPRSMRFPQFEVISLKRKLQLPYVSHHFLLGNIFRQAQISEDIFCVLPKWLAFSKSFLWFNVYSHSLGDKINEDSILVCLHHHILHTVNSGCSINIKIKWMNEPTWKKKETVFKTFRQKKKKKHLGQWYSASELPEGLLTHPPPPPLPHSFQFPSPK